jgi:hypothetical protein
MEKRDFSQAFLENWKFGNFNLAKIKNYSPALTIIIDLYVYSKIFTTEPEILVTLSFKQNGYFLYV